MQSLDAAEVVQLAERMVETPWSWDAAGLDAWLGQLGLERDGDLADIALLALRSDRLPGQAGIVQALETGEVFSVSVSLTEVAGADDAAAQAELDKVAADAKAALTSRFGRPTGGKKPTWKLGDRALALRRLAPVVRLTLVHEANLATFEGR